MHGFIHHYYHLNSNSWFILFQSTLAILKVDFESQMNFLIIWNMLLNIVIKYLFFYDFYLIVDCCEIFGEPGFTLLCGNSEVMKLSGIFLRQNKDGINIPWWDWKDWVATCLFKAWWFDLGCGIWCVDVVFKLLFCMHGCCSWFAFVSVIVDLLCCFGFVMLYVNVVFHLIWCVNGFIVQFSHILMIFFVHWSYLWKIYRH
jgi:hypothetical protein